MSNQRLELIEEIYGTVGESDQWTTIARRLADMTNGAASIFAQGVSSPIYQEFSYGYDPGYVESYRQYYGRLNSFVPYVLHQPRGTVVPCTEVMRRSDFERTEFVTDWALPQGWHHYAMAAIDVDADLGVFLAVTRGQEASAFSADELRFVEAIVPHIRRAIGLSLRLAGSEKAGRFTTDLLGQLGFAAFTLNRAGAVIEMNESAQALAANGLPFRIRNGRLQAREADATERLHRSIRDVADGGIGTSLLVGEGEAAVQATLVPRPRTTAFASIGLPGVLLLVKNGSSEGAVDALRQSFRLTPAEVRLLEALAAGASTARYCDEAGLSRNTVKTQLKSLFAKTGTSRQADLVRLVLGGPALPDPRAP